MRAVVVRQTGGPEVLRIEAIATPTVGPRNVLIRVAACGVCTLDVVTRNGTYVQTGAQIVQWQGGEPKAIFPPSLASTKAMWPRRGR